MTQHLLRLCVAAALIGVPAASFAQDEPETPTTTTGTSGGNITVQILSIAGKSQDTVGTVFFGLDACLDDSAEVEFRLDVVPERESFDVYVGPTCNTPESRDGDGEGDCDLIQGDIAINGLTQNVRVKLGVRDIIEAANGTEGCGTTSSKPKLWFLAVDNSGTAEAVVEADYGWRELNIDTDPPEAPTSITGRSGENQIPITWKVGGEEVSAFAIYVDSGGSGGPISDAATPPPVEDDMDGGDDDEPGESNDECRTGALVEGAAADTVNGYLAKTVRSATATSTNLSSSDIDGNAAAVAVVAIDEAGNKSTLSKVVCVTVVPTTGFKDLYEQEHGEIPQGCPCAAAGPAQLEGALPIALALTVLAYRRRRRS